MFRFLQKQAGTTIMNVSSLAHIAIAVKDLEKARLQYAVLGFHLSEPQPLPEHGVTVCFIKLPNVLIELLEPLGKNSPIEKFLEKNPEGGLHHLCFRVSDIHDTQTILQKKGYRILDTEEPKLGSHNLPVLFSHPKDFGGVLIEFEEKPEDIS